MKCSIDLHLHSKYSRAVSGQMQLPQIARWAKIKGIDLLGTGDFTHPLWFIELKSNLEEVGQGVFGIKFDQDTKFLLTTEISSIYNQAGKTRKIHNLIIAPSINVVERINSELKKKGCNLISDGRPIIGLSAKNLAELVFGVDSNCLIIPAHIWTPWFSMFGANSGFESIEECFGEFSKNIYAVETGLSSDPEMNWKIADLDERTIVSFSDAHSLQKLGRECTVLEVGEISYRGITEAITDNKKILYTVEFYPEEGKYHFSGHRKCKIVYSAGEILKKGFSCPVCGKALTVGVADQVEKLAKNSQIKPEVLSVTDEFGVKWIRTQNRPAFVKIVPLAEIIAETFSCGISAQRVEKEYEKLTGSLGSEIEIIMQKKPEDLVLLSGEKLTQGIMKVRSGDIVIEPGFDGVYGKVGIWPSFASPSGELRKDESNGREKGEQIGLFW